MKNPFKKNKIKAPAWFAEEFHECENELNNLIKFYGFDMKWMELKSRENLLDLLKKHKASEKEVNKLFLQMDYYTHRIRTLWLKFRLSRFEEFYAAHDVEMIYESDDKEIVFSSDINELIWKLKKKLS